MPSTPNFSDGMSSPSETMTPPVVNTTQRPMERCSVITNGREVMNQVGGALHPGRSQDIVYLIGSKRTKIETARLINKQAFIQYTYFSHLYTIRVT